MTIILSQLGLPQFPKFPALTQFTPTFADSAGAPLVITQAPFISSSNGYAIADKFLFVNFSIFGLQTSTITATILITIPAIASLMAAELKGDYYNLITVNLPSLFGFEPAFSAMSQGVSFIEIVRAFAQDAATGVLTARSYGFGSFPTGANIDFLGPVFGGFQ